MVNDGRSGWKILRIKDEGQMWLDGLEVLKMVEKLVEEKKEKRGRSKQGVILQKRDVEILRLLAKFGYCTEKHVMKLCGLGFDMRGKWVLNRILRRLGAAGYLRKHKLLAKQDAYVLLEKRGADLLATGKPRGIVLNTLAHDMLVIDLYLKLRDGGADKEIKSEREARIEQGVRIREKRHLPDLLLAGRIAVEVEISEKSAARLQAIVNSHLLNQQTAEVWYYVRSAALGKKIYEMARQHEKFKVFLFRDEIELAQELYGQECSQVPASRSSGGAFDFSRFR